MRIVHLITRMILGGAQENTLLTCEGLLRDYGDEVLLVTGPALGPEGSLLERARAGGVPVELVDALRRPIHPWRDLVSYHRIKRILRDFRPDVVHTHSAKAGMIGRAVAWKLAVPAVIHGVHGAPFHPYQGRGGRALFRACERWAAKRCHAMISVADAMTDLMVDARVAPREMFTTILSGMEIEPLLAADSLRQEARRTLGYLDEHVVVTTIARLFPLKGHEYIVRAASRVIGQNRNVRFLWVGDGILKDRLLRKIADSGLQEHFQLLGLVAPGEIPRLLAASDMVAHASLREGLARVLPQALIAGKPAISYDIDGAREVVLPGQTGYLLPPQSVDRLAEAVVELAADGDLRDRMGREGRRRFAEVFAHQRMTEQIRALYERVLSAD